MYLIKKPVSVIVKGTIMIILHHKIVNHSTLSKDSVWKAVGTINFRDETGQPPGRDFPKRHIMNKKCVDKILCRIYPSLHLGLSHDRLSSPYEDVSMVFVDLQANFNNYSTRSALVWFHVNLRTQPEAMERRHLEVRSTGDTVIITAPYAAFSLSAPAYQH